MSRTRQSESRRKTTGGKRSVEKKKSSARRVSEPSEGGIWAEVRLVVLIIVSVLLFFSNFGFGGKVGGFMSHVLFGYVGIFILLSAILIYICNIMFCLNKLTLEMQKKKKLALFLAVFTAPYLFYLPVEWFA